MIAKEYLAAYAIGQQRAAEKDSEFDPTTKASHRSFLVYSVAAFYNKDDSYVSSVSEMHSQLIDYFYPQYAAKPWHWSDSIFY